MREREAGWLGLQTGDLSAAPSAYDRPYPRSMRTHEVPRQTTPEELAQWRAFLGEIGATPARVAEARLHAAAKMREPRAQWHFDVVDGSRPDHHLHAWIPRSGAWRLKRYTEDQLREMRVDLLLWMRTTSALFHLVRDGAPADLGERTADVLDKLKQWRREIEARIDEAARA